MTSQEKKEYELWHYPLEEVSLIFSKDLDPNTTVDITDDIILNYWYSHKRYIE